VPELPEAETIVRGLRPEIVGRTIEAVEVLREDLLATPSRHFRDSLTGGTIRAIRRRGKNLALTIEGPATRGSRPGILVINLGMSGRLVLVGPRASPTGLTHPGVRFHLDDGSMLVYHDVRRFGRLAVLDPASYRRWSRSLGPEPLARTFTAAELVRRLGGSVSPVRSWLLDQRRIAGVGNIYANEALFRARIHPRRSAETLAPEEGRRLHRHLRAVLREAIRDRGTTLRDYRTSEGSEGSYAVKLRVYGREDRPCSRCATPIERVTFGGRSAYYCPKCQRRPD
jgi:formamidopyrimidine-DNA glycosylase